MHIFFFLILFFFFTSYDAVGIVLTVYAKYVIIAIKKVIQEFYKYFG